MRYALHIIRVAFAVSRVSLTMMTLAHADIASIAAQPAVAAKPEAADRQARGLRAVELDGRV